jgi:hypothetical protein
VEPFSESIPSGCFKRWISIVDQDTSSMSKLETIENQIRALPREDAEALKVSRLDSFLFPGTRAHTTASEVGLTPFDTLHELGIQFGLILQI